jgi:hypothetical protein
MRSGPDLCVIVGSFRNEAAIPARVDSVRLGAAGP